MGERRRRGGCHGWSVSACACSHGFAALVSPRLDLHEVGCPECVVQAHSDPPATPPPPQWETVTIGGMTLPTIDEQRAEFLQRVREMSASGVVLVLPRGTS